MIFEIINSDDGSNTIYLPELDETYHSKFGAIAESKHVFINNGLKSIRKKNIQICEIGYGTGLNCFLSLLHSKHNSLNINYIAFEKNPLDNKILEQLNYGQLCKNTELFSKINSVSWNKSHKISDNFTLTKIHANVLDRRVNFPHNTDIIYFDAFAPSKQKEMWNTKLFTRLFDALSDDGIFVSYSSAGLVKQALKQANFSIKRLPGPKGKFHMLTAYKAKQTIDLQ